MTEQAATPGGCNTRLDCTRVPGDRGLCPRFASKVAIRSGDQQAEADDILQVMSLGVPEGAEITLSARGADADEVLDALAELFAQNFGFDD